MFRLLITRTLYHKYHRRKVVLRRRCLVTQEKKPSDGKIIAEESTWNDYLTHRMNQISQQIRAASTTQDVQALLKEMERKRYNMWKIFGYLGLFGGTLILLSAKQIKSFLSTQTSEVTTKSMNDENFKQQVNELASSTSKEVLNQLLADQELRQKLTGYTRELLKEAVIELYQTQDFKDETQRMFGDLITSPLVQDKANQLTKNVVNQVLLDEELQRQTGSSLLNAAYFGIIPQYFTRSKQVNKKSN